MSTRLTKLMSTNQADEVEDRLSTWEEAEGAAVSFLSARTLVSHGSGDSLRRL